MADTAAPDLMEKLVSLCKRRGFIFQSSEIYGGINGFWDYGPMGASSSATSRTRGGRTSSAGATTWSGSTARSS